MWFNVLNRLHIHTCFLYTRHILGMEDMAVQYSTEMNKKNIGEKGGSSNKKGHKMDFLMILRAKVASIAFVVVLEYPLLYWCSC